MDTVVLQELAVEKQQRRLLGNSAALAGLIFLFAFYWRGVGVWFYQDDFGWLHLGPAKDFGNFLSILFAPKAHGNIRPWSENLFFYGLKALFGVHALPFRIVVFATAAADIVLLTALVRRLTNSALAAALAPVLWLANPNVAPALAWTSIYNQTQYLFFVLLAFLLFLRGKYWQQVIVFVLGLGSLETAVMYPVIVLAYTLLFDRKQVRRTPPLFAISAAYTALHFWVAPTAQSGPYAIRIDARIFGTLAAYAKMAMGAQALTHFHWNWPAWLTVVGTALVGGGIVLAIFAAGRVGLFGAAWFLALLIPMLPLPEHILDYVLTGPAMGLAIILAAAVGRHPRIMAPVAALYLAICLPAAWDVTTWRVSQGEMSKNLVQSIVAYDRAHPVNVLLITGLDTAHFYNGFADRPFEPFGFQNVYIAPGGARKVDDVRGWLPRYQLPPATVKALLNAGKATILDVSSGQARDVSPK